MYAVIETGGKQYRVQEGDVIFVEKLGLEENASCDFTNVLVLGDDNNIELGKPYISGAVVKATVLKNGKGKKVLMMRYKPKKGVRVKRGHRQLFTKVKIESITK